MTKLEERRKRRGWSQKRLSDATGGQVSQSSISQYENRKYEPRMPTLRVLAKALRCKPAVLLETEAVA